MIYKLRSAKNLLTLKTNNIPNDNILIWKKKYALKAPDIAWLSDITEFYVCNCKFYICSIEDIFSRYVISINISTANDTALVANTFNDAYKKKKTTLWINFSQRPRNEFYRNKPSSYV